MIDRGKHNILGVSINAIDYDAAVEKIVDAAKADRRCAVTALAVHGVMTGVMDKKHRHRLNQFELVVPDGQPVRWALNRLHKTNLSDRVYGPNLMLHTCARAATEEIPIFLMGGDQKLLDELSAALTQKFPGLRIAGTRPSKFRQLDINEKQELIDEVRASGAKITFVGLGCPRQEVFAYEFSDALSMPLLAVGAAFAFHAGQLAQAPHWMQRAGLEWAFRFSKEPLRLWKRYMYLNPLYVTLLGLQMTRVHRPNINDTVEPTEELLYG